MAAYAHLSFRLHSREARVWNRVVNSKWNNAHLAFPNAKVREQLVFHPSGVNEDVVAQSVLNSQ